MSPPLLVFKLVPTYSIPLSSAYLPTYLYLLLCLHLATFSHSLFPGTRLTDNAHSPRTLILSIPGPGGIELTMERRPKARRSVDFVPHDPNAAPMPKHRQAASPNKPLQERSRNAPVVQRPLRKVAEGIHVAKKHSKSKQTVSIAGVLKKRARVPHRRRHSRKEPTPEATLLDDVQGTHFFVVSSESITHTC